MSKAKEKDHCKACLQAEIDIEQLEAERDAYREAGARLLQAFQGQFCIAADTMEDCLKTVDMEAEIILSKESTP